MPSPRREPVAAPPRFDPLDPSQIGASLRRAIEERDLTSFPPPQFTGAGLYAIYWVGSGGIYDRLRDRDAPVYVGKAEAGNSSYGYEPDYGEKKLWGRIDKHARRVAEVEGNPDAGITRTDFRVRYLPLDDAWIVLGERALLRAYRPVLWNSIMNGFGSNPPGQARTNPLSVWDTIHPGRRAAGMPNRFMTRREMLDRVARGVEISVMGEGTEREAALTALRTEKLPVIWALADRKDPDRRMRVFDETRFLAEARRLSLTLGPDDYRLATATAADQAAAAAEQDVERTPGQDRDE